MKRVIFILSAVVCFSCASQRQINKEKTGRLGIRDSTQYELIIFDIGFDSWAVSNQFRYGDYSNEYYQSANFQYVMEWNRRFAAGDRRINSYIDYSMGTDYGYEFNKKLFMYFKYWQDANRTKLLPGL